MAEGVTSKKLPATALQTPLIRLEPSDCRVVTMAGSKPRRISRASTSPPSATQSFRSGQVELHSKASAQEPYLIHCVEEEKTGENKSAQRENDPLSRRDSISKIKTKTNRENVRWDTSHCQARIKVRLGKCKTNSRSGFFDVILNRRS